MIDISPFTDQQYWKLCDFNVGLPVPLYRADLTRPFVYDRRWGLFAAMDCHVHVMSLLLAFKLGVEDGIEAGELLKLEYPWATADRFLQGEGTAFKSSQSALVHAWRPENLHAVEKSRFDRIQYVG